MKKILAVAIVAIMTVALCISASATLNIDRIFIDHNVMAGGEDVKGSAITINAGQKLFILGWAANPDGKLIEIVYTVDGGADVKCPDNYRDRADVVSAGIAAADGGAHAGFGHDTEEEGGLLELTGIDKLNGGTYQIAIKAVYANDAAPDLYEFTLTVEGELPAEQTEQPSENPPSGDAAIIAIAAVGCVALAGVVVAKKVR